MNSNITRYILLMIVLLCGAQGFAQTRQINRNGQNNTFLNQQGMGNDSLESNKIDAKTIPHEVHSWRVDPRLGEIIPTDVDTLFLNFQNSNETWGMNGEYNMLGNLGSPRLSRIFVNRKNTSDSFFLDPFDFYLRTPENQTYFNTKSPWTNLNYWTCGDKTVGDDRFKVTFTVNANKRLNFGFVVDYLYGKGYYQNQGLAYFNGTLFSSYSGDKYKMHAFFSHNHMKMNENGGIENDMYIIDPTSMGEGITSNTIPTVLDNTWNRNDAETFYFNHQYNVGFHRMVNDSTREFVPVTSFIHTLQIDQNNHQFISYDTPDNYYKQDFLSGDTTLDKTRYRAIKNTFAIQLKEGFNKWAQAGLTGFVTANVRSYRLPQFTDDGNLYNQSYNESIISVGGILSRNQGKHINYKAVGEAFLTGAEAGDFSLEGNLGLNFKFLGDTINLAGHAFLQNKTPNFYLRHYHSRHYWWDNSLDKETRTRIEGTFSAKHLGTQLRVAAETIKNYTYLDNISEAYTNTSGVVGYKNNIQVSQSSSSIEVFTAQLKQNLHFGIINWDNELTYQTTSNADVLPLPKLNVYSNLYLKFNLVKNVLRMQIGADARYFTKYYAPDYAPGLGQYYLQNPENRVSIGNYPIISSYVNAEWKRARIYVQVFSHVNEGMGNARSFLVPHYPINPQVLKIGISWSFYD